MPRYGTVIFDCDSTLSAIEGIEELAAEKRPEIERLTEAAMQGVVPLEEVYGRRLELIRPHREQVQRLGALYVERIVPGAQQVVGTLLTEGIEVRVVTGGLEPAVHPLMTVLGLQPHQVAAVAISFDSDGNYAGFDEKSPLTRAGGKLEVISRWRPELPGPVMLVGDGATDLEARPAVDLFVAFAGVIEREPVVAAADVVIRSRSLAPVLALALEEGLPVDPAANLHPT